MPFKPDPNTYYYLVAKHSGKVLEVRDAATASDAVIQQGAATADKTHQHFKFDQSGDRVFAIRCEPTQMVLDVKDISTDDGAAVMQHPWHSGNNQRFRVLDAGNGHYFIEAVHSGKFLAVSGGSKDDRAALEQRQNPATGGPDQFLFRPVLATKAIAPELLPGFDRPTQILRDVALGVLGLIPKAGGAIKFVTGALWPDNSQQMFWDQITQYVERLVEAKLTRERIIRLQEALEGARKNLDEFNELNPGAEKISNLNGAIQVLNLGDRPFFRAETPEKTAAYLLTMGTLKLTLLRERVVSYTQISGLPRDDNAAAHLKALKDGIGEYARAARRFRADLMTARLAKVEAPYQRVGHRNQDITFHVRDAYDGGEHRRRVFEPYDERLLARIEKQLVKTSAELARTTYDAELDALFAPSLLWQSFEPGKPEAQKRTVRAALGPFGTDFNASVDLNNGRPIVGVRVYGDSRVRGLQVAVPGGSGLPSWGILIGKDAGTRHELLLKAGERIISVYGNADHELTALRFETGFGRRVGAGDEIGAPRWNADVPPELDAELTRVAASPSADDVDRRDSVGGVTLTWDYIVRGDYPAPTRRKRGAAKKATRRKAAKKTTRPPRSSPHAAVKPASQRGPRRKPRSRS